MKNRINLEYLFPRRLAKKTTRAPLTTGPAAEARRKVEAYLDEKARQQSLKDVYSLDYDLEGK